MSATTAYMIGFAMFHAGHSFEAPFRHDGEHVEHIEHNADDLLADR